MNLKRTSRVFCLTLTIAAIAFLSTGSAEAFCPGEDCGSPINRTCTVQMFQRCRGNDFCRADVLYGFSCTKDCIILKYLTGMRTRDIAAHG